MLTQDHILYAELLLKTEPTLFMREIAEALFIEHDVVYEAFEVRKAIYKFSYLPLLQAVGCTT